MGELKTKVKIDPNQTELTEEQNAALAAEAMQEMDADERGEAEPEEVEAEAEPANTELEPEAEETEEEESAKPGDEEAEPVAEDEEQEDAPKEGEEAEPKGKQKTEAEILRDYALKHNLTEEEAKEEMAAVKGIIGKYKTPEEMARAMRSTQSAYDKLKAQAPKPGEEPPKPTANAVEPEAGISEYIEKNREQLLKDYAAKYPAKSRSLDEDAILEEIADKMNDRLQAWRREEMAKAGDRAKTRREELLQGLSKEDAKFLPDVKAVLYKTSDAHVLREGFDLKDLLRWAKGAKYDADVKAAREEGIRIGKENPKIAGELPRGGQGKNPPKKAAGSTKSIKLSEAQKKRASEMYEHIGGTPEEHYKMFIETYEDELKENPAFLG